MKLYFDLAEFDQQLMRAISYTPYGGADISECLACASRIVPGDFDSWFNEWNSLALNLEAAAEHSLDHGHLVSAREAYLRASNYFRTALFFKYGHDISESFASVWESHHDTFAKALTLTEPPVVAVAIPFENGHLPGYLFLADDKNTPKPTVIVLSGYDGSCQESYLAVGIAALRRGYNVLVFDGPGQGEMLIQRSIPMRHDWEHVVTPVINWLQQIDEVDNGRIALFGPSWASLLAPRAAAFEHRLAALIAYPGIFNPLEPMFELMPAIETYIKTGDRAIIDPFMQHVANNKLLNFKFISKAWIHGLDNPADLFLEWSKYNLEGLASKIICPTFIGDNRNETYSKGQAKRLFAELKCPKKYVLFKDDLGSGEHCCAGGLLYFHQRVFDWLDDHLQTQNVNKSIGLPTAFEL